MFEKQGWSHAENRTSVKRCSCCKRPFVKWDLLYYTVEEISIMRGDDVVTFYCVECAKPQFGEPPVAMVEWIEEEQYRIKHALPKFKWNRAAMLEHQEKTRARTREEQ